MYRVLIVDVDKTCLAVATAYLKKLNYQVMGVTCALQALSILARDNGEKQTYDLVLAEVHMPAMDGFKLVQHVHRDFNIPVILMSADDKTESIGMGLGIGASAYYLKPLKVDDVRHIWQFSELWKNREIYACRRTICSSSTNTNQEKKTRNNFWTPNLHTRFVEVILILGLRRAIPKNILKLMNAPSLTRVQVGSHLQKFKKYLVKVLDGKLSLQQSSKKWIDYNYYSTIVRGNPNKILIKQLFERRRTGYWPAPLPASLPLPAFVETATSSTLGHVPVTFQSAANAVATPALQIGASAFQGVVNVSTPTLQSAPILNKENFLGSGISTSSIVAEEFGNAFAMPAGNEQAPKLDHGVGVADTSPSIHNNAEENNILEAVNEEMDDWEELWTLLRNIDDDLSRDERDANN